MKKIKNQKVRVNNQQQGPKFKNKGQHILQLRSEGQQTEANAKKQKPGLNNRSKGQQTTAIANKQEQGPKNQSKGQTKTAKAHKPTARA